MNRESIKPLNDKGQQHGYWEMYWGDGHLIYKCLFHNGEIVGYEENYGDDYYFNKMLYKKKYHI
jgi:hypothetical protein